ncbi:hypothetical protein L596_005970 [Steinernema carpocapsae]|uniref:eIF-4F 25 kDa subunit n=1 Tax=Steinernema carpocapsae TaxID=34508 RepID=A0A4U8V793_STECR|nr:hypothetical protein L596_005970 [Steinernema carpocapsae]
MMGHCDAAPEEVPEDPIQPPPIHPLRNSWTFWLCNWDSNSNNGHPLRELDTVDSAEGLFRAYSALPRPSAFGNGTDLCVFRRGIKPEWEDPNNVNGGRWVACVLKTDPGHKTTIDLYWVRLLVNSVGERFGEWNQKICGVRVRIRERVYLISLWIRHFEPVESHGLVNVGRLTKSALKIREDQTIGFRTHAFSVTIMEV